jgi:phosphatidylinositol alpha-1,6-mannosyltransferase
MRLLVTCDFPPEKGGIQSYLDGIVRFTYTKDDVVLVACSRKNAGFDGGYSAKVKRVSVPFSNFNKKFSLAGVLLFLIINPRLWRRNVKVECGNVYAAIPSWIISRLGGPGYHVYTYGTELVAIARNLRATRGRQIDSSDNPSGWISRAKSALLMKVLKDAAGLYALGSYTRSLISELAVTLPVTIEPPKIVLQKSVARKNKTGSDKFVVLCVARLVGHKGHAILIEALSQLASKCPWELVIVGDGPQKFDIEKLCENKGIKDRVMIKGSCSDRELEDEYCRADALVLPSLETARGTEGFGIVMLEAMAHMVPVIASDTGGIPDVLDNGKCGILVPPGDASALAGAIEMLRKDGKAGEEYAQRAHERLLSKYVWAAPAQTRDAPKYSPR